MKAIAIILAACLFLLSTGHLLEILQPEAGVAVASCCADCTPDCCDGEQAPRDGDSSCHDDTACTPGCACSCDFQLSALAYEFMELRGTMVQSYHYGNYLNTYSYEYAGEFLQPPRKA